MTIITYKDEKEGAKELHLTTVVDPEGYIYRMSGSEEARIKDAKVTLLMKNKSTNVFETWTASKYKQVNPQKTDKSGSYSFLVPEGKYKITVSAPGYYDFTGAEFEVVEGRGVHENIELKAKSWWRSVLRFIGVL